MKWQNKGYEFDEWCREIAYKNICFIGDDKNFRSTTNFLNLKYRNVEIKTKLKKIRGVLFLVRALINLNLAKNFYDTLKLNNEIIVVSDEDILMYKFLITSKRLKADRDIFLESVFFNKYFPIYVYKKFNKIYNPFSTCIVLTTLCSLNCKYCLNYQPYIKNKQHNNYEDLIKDIDVFFATFDRVKSFSLTGGEPLLYPKLPDLLNYIYKNYSDRIEHLWFATNGTIVPSDDLCRVIKDANAEVIIDNYTQFVPKLKDSYYMTVQKCKDFCLKYKEGHIESFFKTFPPAKNYYKYSDKKLIQKYNTCKSLYSGFGLKNGKLFACCYSQFAETAELVKSTKGDYFDLLTNKNSLELIEFILGYLNKGYTEFCKYCNCFYAKSGGGYDEKGVSQQSKEKLLEWDFKNPTKEPVEVNK